MSKEALVLIFGLLVFVTALLGIPASLKVPIHASLGALIILFGYLSLRARHSAEARRMREEKNTVSDYHRAEETLAI